MSLMFTQANGTWITSGWWGLWRTEESFPMTGLLQGLNHMRLRRISESPAVTWGQWKGSPTLAFSHPSHFCPQPDTWWKKRRERLMPIAEVCNLMARNQTCHMWSNHHSVGDRVKTVEKTVAIPTSNFQVIVGAEISLTSSVFILENLQSTL